MEKSVSRRRDTTATLSPSPQTLERLQGCAQTLIFQLRLPSSQSFCPQICFSTLLCSELFRLQFADSHVNWLPPGSCCGTYYLEMVVGSWVWCSNPASQPWPMLPRAETSPQGHQFLWGRPTITPLSNWWPFPCPPCFLLFSSFHVAVASCHCGSPRSLIINSLSAYQLSHHLHNQLPPLSPLCF